MEPFLVLVRQVQLQGIALCKRAARKEEADTKNREAGKRRAFGI
jgi:hypothetical protein